MKNIIDGEGGTGVLTQAKYVQNSINVVLEIMRRLVHLRSIRGKFAHLHTSSEAFAQRKKKEIELEG